jgi:hypothetical protein
MVPGGRMNTNPIKAIGWYENEVGRYQRLRQDDANPDWELALVKIKS